VRQNGGAHSRIVDFLRTFCDYDPDGLIVREGAFDDGDRVGAQYGQPSLTSNQLQRLTPRLRTVGLGCREASAGVPAVARFSDPDL
jgi:hypothetical protein